MQNKRSLLLLIFTLFWANVFFSQKISFLPQIKVGYAGVLKLGDNVRLNQDFFLIGNMTDYYFAAEYNFLKDTKQYINKSGLDLASISDEFVERVIYNENVFHLLFTEMDANIYTSEKNKIHWVLYKDFKNIQGVRCQLATTNMYGRRWKAYFSTAYPQAVGPYKFAGLPGLILELYDTRDDYHFTMTSIEKYSKPFGLSLNNYKNLSKTNYKKAKENLQYGLGKYPDLEGEMKKETEDMLKVLKKMNNNPIELE